MKKPSNFPHHITKAIKSPIIAALEIQRQLQEQLLKPVKTNITAYYNNKTLQPSSSMATHPVLRLENYSPISSILEIQRQQWQTFFNPLNSPLAPIWEAQRKLGVSEVIKAINEQLSFYQHSLNEHELANAPLYRLIGDLDSVNADDELDEDEKNQRILSIAKDFLANLIESAKTQLGKPMLSALGIKLLDYAVAVAITYHFFLLSASNADMQEVKTTVTQIEQQQQEIRQEQQELENKMDELLALMKQNEESIPHSITIFYQTIDTANVYAEANENTTIISILPKNEVVVALSQKEQWIQIQFSDYVFSEIKTGWVQEIHLQSLFTPKTPLVKKLLALKQQAIAEGMVLLDEEQILEEVKRRRGEI